MAWAYGAWGLRLTTDRFANQTSASFANSLSEFLPPGSFPQGSKYPNNRVSRSKKPFRVWILGPKTLLFGYSDPLGLVALKLRRCSPHGGIRGGVG